MNIYFEVENFNREMESRILMGLEAAYNDNIVYISDRMSILKKAEANKIEPGTLFLKDVNSSTEIQTILKNIKKLNFTILATDEEAGIQFQDYQNFIKVRSIRKFENIDVFLCWGLRDKKILKEKYSSYKTKFLALGSARLDLCKKEISKKKKYNSLKKKFKDNYIFISSNISYPISIRPLPEYIGSRIVDDKIDVDLREKFYYYKYINNTIRCYYLVKLIRKLLHTFPYYTFILRPHPNEEIESWNKILANKYSNLIIDKSGSLQDYIFNSDLIIHTGCTSGIEAALMKKKSISYAPESLKNSLEGDFSNNISNICKNENEVIDAIKNLEKLKLKSFEDFKTRIINPFYSKSFKKINLLFKKFQKTKNYKNKNCDQIFKKENMIRNLKNKFKNFIFFMLNIKNNSQISSKFPDLDYLEIKNLFIELKQIDNKYEKIKFKILNNKTIKIFKQS